MGDRHGDTKLSNFCSDKEKRIALKIPLNF